MKCPLCGCLNTRKVRTIDVEPVIKLWWEFFKTDIRTEFRGCSQLELWRCRRCRLFFFFPDTVVGSPQMYAELSRVDWYYPAWKWEYETALADLRGCRRVLEIGCGSGSFMVGAKREASLCVEGIEQSTEAIEEAAVAGLVVRRSTAEEAAEQSPGAYDGVCAFQVLEHVPNPRRFIEACCQLLRPGGLLALAMPNQNSYVRFMVIPLDMPPHHQTRWTRHPLERLQAFFPLRLRHIACEPLPDTDIGFCLETLVDAVRRKNPRFVPHPWLVSRTIRLIRRFRLNTFLRGQNIYACYVRE